MAFTKSGLTELLNLQKRLKPLFYNYFSLKERLIEMSLTFQKDGLKHEVLSIINVQKDLTVIEKFRKNLLFTCRLRWTYHLPFKAIFEIAKTHPKGVSGSR